MSARLDLEVPEASMHRVVVTIVGGPDSLAGYVGRLQARENKLSALPDIDLGAESISVNNTNRQVTIFFPDDATLGLPWEVGVYDAYLTGTGGDRWRFLEGIIKVSRAVTREV